MRFTSTVFALFLATACSDIGLFPQTDAGADGGIDDEGGDAATPIALDCARDPQAGIELCAAISACPDVWVERDRFPHCGFRPRPDAIELACVCDGAICSMGLASTCQDARALLQTQSELTVCMQVHEGRCLESQPQSPPSSDCDPVCISECAGNPTCYQFCC